MSQFMDDRNLHGQHETQQRGNHVTVNPQLRKFTTVIAVLVWQVGERQNTPARKLWNYCRRYQCCEAFSVVLITLI